MTNIIIRAQATPQRCKICHHQDQFDPINNYCSPCTDLIKTLPSLLNKQSNNLPPRSAIFFIRLMRTGDGVLYRFLCAGQLFFAGLLFWFVRFSEYGNWPDTDGIFSKIYFAILLTSLGVIVSSITPLKVVKAVLIAVSSLLIIIVAHSI